MTSVSALWNQSKNLWSPGVAAENVTQMFESAQEKLHARPGAADLRATDTMFKIIYDQTNAANMHTMAVILLIFESISLYAAYLMWNLQKRGFYLYLAGIAIAFFTPLLLIGGWFGAVNAIAGVFFSCFMAILYAFNLKHMH
ncbi:hypothetical protein HWI92_22720 [Dyadobacter sandarakinus]|uniref:Uncharacterized protein n=2 Tax=Dyadobacter sandarakinus TaxID=2747268 RepID=A0ABX7IES3_9BACT|nr:hypothetical protein HWI92_22720 [Dyadobacter sandarakinus]